VTKSILVTGAGGFVGQAVVARLAADGHRVVAAGRSLLPVPAGATPLALGDIRGSIDWGKALSGIDHVVHCAARAHVLNEEAVDPLAAFRAVNRDATIALARVAAAAGVRRFVFISSIGVNGNETEGEPFTAADTPRPHSDYAVAKWEAEKALSRIAQETDLEPVVIRPPLVIGPDAKGNLGTLTRAIRKGLPLPLGMVTRNRRDFVSLETLVDLIAVTLEHPAAPGDVLLVSDDAPLSTRSLVERLGALINVRPRFIPVPPALLRLPLTALGQRNLASQLIGDLELDIGATKARLGWAPPRSSR
jgi:nucleoside-diphosphate-sugar epimerase